MKFAQGDQDDFVQLIRAEVSTWSPEAGADWDDLLTRVDRVFSRWVLYPVSGAALTTILVAAFLVMTALHVGPVHDPVPAHLP